MTVYERAVGLLARREHSRKELKRKLLQKNYDPMEIAEAIDLLVERGFLSEERFAEMRTRALIRQGYGVRYIIEDLGSDGVSTSSDKVDEVFRELGLSESQVMEEQALKKLRSGGNRERLIRFLLRRGFEPRKVMTLCENLSV